MRLKESESQSRSGSPLISSGIILELLRANGCLHFQAFSGYFVVEKKNLPDFAVRRRALHNGSQGFSKFRFVVLNASKKIKMQVCSMPFRCDLIQEGWRNIMQM